MGGFFDNGDPQDRGEPSHPWVKQCTLHADGRGGARAGSICHVLGRAFDVKLERNCDLHRNARIDIPEGPLDPIDDDIGEEIPFECRLAGTMTRDKETVLGVIRCAGSLFGTGIGSFGSFAMVRH